MTAANKELELRLELTGEELERVQTRPAFRELAIGEPATHLLRSLYFDTLDRRLHEEGLSLRVRRVGESWLQTVKCVQDTRSGVSHPIELEASVEGPEPQVSAIPDKAVRRKVKKAVGKAPLVPLFETVVQRTAQRLKAPEGTEIEIAFDKGVVRGAEGAKDLWEAEFELKSGSTDALVDVANAVFADEPIRLSEANGADWGSRLASKHKPAKPLEPQKSSAPPLRRAQSCAEAFCEICRVAADQILHNWSVTSESDDPEGTHQMRIGLRRLRSAFKIFRPVIDNGPLRELDANARDLGRLLGELRDADVLATDIVGRAAANRGDDADLKAFNAALADDRAGHRSRVRTGLKGRQWSCFKLKLAMLPESIERLAATEEGQALGKPILPVTGKALKKWWRRVRKSGRRFDKLSVAERHEMRKDVKTLRYGIELLEPLYRTKDVRRFTKKLRKLQDALGYLNDLAVAEKLRLVRTEAVTGEPDLQRAVGYVIGWHTARAEQARNNARSVWKRSAQSRLCLA